MPQQEIICIGCPQGCRVTVKSSDKGEIESLNGNKCKEGVRYITSEFKAPVRIFTATLLSEGDDLLLTVRTDKPVHKGQFKGLMRAVAKVRVKLPVKMGEEIIHNILGTGANLIATKSLSMTQT